jgi:hypothetical protein
VHGDQESNSAHLALLITSNALTSPEDRETLLPELLALQRSAMLAPGEPLTAAELGGTAQ